MWESASFMGSNGSADIISIPRYLMSIKRGEICENWAVYASSGNSYGDLIDVRRAIKDRQLV